VTVEAPRLVRCGTCGGSFELSPRNVRAARARGEEPTCRICRRTAKPPDEAASEKLRRWWLERYSLEELVELGREIGWC
jgi:hypothetical protein